MRVEKVELRVVVDDLGNDFHFGLQKLMPVELWMMRGVFKGLAYQIVRVRVLKFIEVNDHPGIETRSKPEVKVGSPKLIEGLY
jgi:hypothetical protein